MNQGPGIFLNFSNFISWMQATRRHCIISDINVLYFVLTFTYHHIISRDLSLGHRVGFYQMKGNVGRGNFSNVKMAIHSLTKGKD